MNSTELKNAASEAAASAYPVYAAAVDATSNSTDTAKVAASTVAAARSAVYTVAQANGLAAVNDAADVANGFSVGAFDVFIQGDFWQQIRIDAQVLLSGKDLNELPLWFRQTAPSWFKSADLKARKIWAKDSQTWAFWGRWWDGVIAGKPLAWELQEQVALIPDGDWKKGPDHIAALIRDIEAGMVNKASESPELELIDAAAPIAEDLTETEKTPLARASLFDFVELNKRLRAIGFPSDLSPFNDSDLRQAFLDDVRDLIDELQDWCDFAQEEFGSNQRSPLRRAVQKLVEQLEDIRDGKPVSFRRLVTLGSDLRRLAISQQYRPNGTLADMLDERLEQYTQISHRHFGSVYRSLEPLQQLELGNHAPGDLIVAIRTAIEQLDALPVAELVPPDPETRAVLNDMLRELEEWDAEIDSETGEKRLKLLRKRFAEKYGSFSVTYGQMIERGQEHAKSNIKRFDEAVKWWRRWETLEKMVDWWNKLGGSGTSGM